MSDTYIPDVAMLIYAHPDDIEFSAAGTAAKWASLGSTTIYVVITDGSVGSHAEGMTKQNLVEIRRSEQLAAAKIAGAAECIFLGYEDGLLQPTLELRKELVALIRRHKPNVVVCGDPTNFFPSQHRINHPDHRAAGTVALDAAFPAAEMPLLYPELESDGLTPHKVNYVYVSNPRDAANFYVNITDTIDVKIEALRQHASQLGDWDPDEPIKKWNAEIGKKVGFEYAEQFLRITLKDPHSNLPEHQEPAKKTEEHESDG